MAKAEASKAGLDPAVVCAVIEQESSWNPWALRFEPAFYTRYVEKFKLAPTEAYSRAFSWGLMQLMGESARENGYKGDLSKLCDPQIGISAGCVHLKKKLNSAGGDVKKALLLWNGGADPTYPVQVMARMDKYQ